MDITDKAKIDHLLSTLGVDILKFKLGAGSIIFISGGACTGKTVMAKKIVQQYPQFRMINTGDFFREEAASMNISLGELIKASDEELMKLDLKVDSRVIKYLIETNESLVVTSRMASVWGCVLKELGKTCMNIAVYVEYGQKIGRMSIREFGKNTLDLSDVELEKLKEEIRRDERDQRRYSKIYGFDPSHFDKYAKTIDTTHLGEDEVWKKIRVLADEFLFGGVRIQH